MVNFPASADTLSNPTSSTKTNDTGFFLDVVISTLNDIAEALEAKVGTGASTPVAATALLGSGTGTTTYDTIARRNLLQNGDMRVKQLGTLGSTDNSYILDGWRMLLEAATAAAASQDTAFAIPGASQYALKFTVGAGNNNKFGAVQVIESADCSHLRSKVVSVQAALKATAGIANVRMALVQSTNAADSGAAGVDIVSAWGADGTNPTLAAGFTYVGTPANLSVTTTGEVHRLPAVGTVNASATNLLLFVWSDDKTTTATTDVLFVTDVQVEEGSVCTAFERRDLAGEIVKCKRRWQQSYSYGIGAATATDAGAEVQAGSDNITTKVMAKNVRFPVGMRTAAPAITIYDAAGNATKISTWNVAGAVTNNVTPSVGVGSQTSDGYLMIHSGTVAGFEWHWTADARL
jgi:hypothetical protein